MSVKDLNAVQLQELKTAHYDRINDGISYGEIVDIDYLVSDDEIFRAYAGYSFVPEDFFT